MSALQRLFLLLLACLAYSFRPRIDYNYRRNNRANYLELATKSDAEELNEIYNHYDGERIDRYYSKKPIEVWERMVEVGSPILGWWILRTYDNITANTRTLEENQRRLQDRAVDLRDAIVQGKSITFIKSGQALALRPDLVKSPEYIQQLQTLQDEVGTFRNDIAMKIISDELGRDASEIYDFNPKLPIASASIGQVYKATLKSTNQTVALKVQRPDAIENAAIDMYILRKLAGLIKKWKKLRTNLVGIADEFGGQLFNELNYTQEACNCVKFKELYGTIPGIYVPDVILDYTTQRVLTMEFVEGVKGPWKQGGEKMLTIGLQCSVLQLLGTGYFHSDPHRGNLLQTPRGELAYLDFGMMAEVPAQKRFALVGSVLGLVNKDIDLVVRNLKELEFFPPETDTKVVVGALNSALFGAMEGGRGSTLNFTRLNENLQQISNLLPLRLPPFYSMIIRSLTILEGLALNVDKDFRLVRGAYPFIARQILNEPSREMNDLLKAILIDQSGRIKWDKLEQFISISSNADAAMAGDFSALKNAQSRSDIIKAYQKDDETDDNNFTFEAITEIMDYLLSDKGVYLRVPLVNEIAETVDALGLTAATVASLLTSKLLPEPPEKPDRAKVENFLKLVNTLVSKSAPSVAKAATNAGVAAVGDSARVMQFSDVLYQAINNPPKSQLDKLQPLISKSSILIGEVVVKLIEINARRFVKVIITPTSVEKLLPTISTLLEFIPKSK